MRLFHLYFYIATLIGVSVISACASAAPLTINALKNAEYQSELTASHQVKLTDGAYQQDIVPSTASKLTITLLDQYAIGDLNGDGAPDAAVILSANTGGSGVFAYLAAVVNDKGSPRNISSIALGDRVQIKSVAISAREIVLDLIGHGPSDPLCCPTQRVSRRFKLQDGNLIEIK